MSIGQPRAVRSEWGPSGWCQNALSVGENSFTDVLHHVSFDRITIRGKLVVLTPAKECYL